MRPRAAEDPMQNTWSIGRTWKPREGWSRPVLMVERQPTSTRPGGVWRRTRQGPAKAHREHGPHTRTISQQQPRPLSGPRTATRRRETPCFPADNPRFAAAMAQERRPVPFRTRKLRPGTAMVLHPTGCGRVARRRTTRTGSPSEHTPQGAFAYPKHSRPKPTHPHKNTRGFSHARTQTGHLRHPHGNGASPYPWDHD